MSFQQAIISFWKRYAEFGGRSSRSEFWWNILFFLIIGLLLNLTILGLEDLGDMLQAGSDFKFVSYFLVGISYIWSIATTIPSWALNVRRLHDSGRSAFHLLWLLLPIIGWIIYIILLCQKSEPIENKYGPTPIA